MIDRYIGQHILIYSPFDTISLYPSQILATVGSFLVLFWMWIFANNNSSLPGEEGEADWISYIYFDLSIDPPILSPLLVLSGKRPSD